MTDQPSIECAEPLPFNSYPSNGREILPLASGSNCRHEYGLRHQRLTGQSNCAFCGRDFTKSYDNWLMMALDHVIPAVVCKAMDLPKKWMDSHSNRMLCCSACNGFKNRWEPDDPLVCPETDARFFDMRDAVFIARREEVRERYAEEERFFDSKPWEKK
jgi:hypothetical protein